MNREGSEDDGATDKPSYLCYKAYIKTAGYVIFISYSMIGIKRLCDHINQWMMLNRCTTCQPYEEGITGVMIKLLKF
ncbi:hypothetical protein LOAG_12001 [Loa loa]|uniref:Uncharacterized protein n=1 Tax=Loa loa TaxID=7209 RepID=A0A1S0TMH9_LOALO|nr:hypothetical protein LOAG_12001 [Loa loa]EFO16505.1 hypothetical protein LOAG_12001 [Loa loa]